MKPLRTLLISLLCVLVCTQSVLAAVPETYSETYVVMDATTGQVLLEKDMNKQMYPASITKILTAAIALRDGNLDDEWEMSYKATHSIDYDSTHIALTEGEIVSVRSLVYTMMIESANDSANGLAEYIAGDIDDFPAIMNETAQEIGAVNSHFTNANGLPDPDHYTTAYDMALITKWALSIDGFRDVFGAEEYTMPADNKKTESFTYGTHNHMLVDSAYYYEGTEGGKLGWTEEAQHTLVELVRRGDMEIIVVLLKSQTQYLKYQDAIALCDYCFDNYAVSTFSGALFAHDPIPVMENGVTVANVTVSTDDISVNRPSTVAKADIIYSLDVPEFYTLGDTIAPQAVFTDRAGEIIATVPLEYTYEQVTSAADTSAATDTQPVPERSTDHPVFAVLLKIMLGLAAFAAVCFVIMLCIRFYNLHIRKRRRKKKGKAKN